MLNNSKNVNNNSSKHVCSVRARFRGEPATPQSSKKMEKQTTGHEQDTPDSTTRAQVRLEAFMVRRWTTSSPSAPKESSVRKSPTRVGKEQATLETYPGKKNPACRCTTHLNQAEPAALQARFRTVSKRVPNEDIHDHNVTMAQLSNTNITDQRAKKHQASHLR